MLKKILLLVLVSLFVVVGINAQDSTKQDDQKTTADTDKPKRGPIFRPTKDQIKQVQGILKAKKLYDMEPSGKYDDETRAGIKVFQKGNGLKETGTLNRATLEKFGVELTDSQKQIPVSPNSYASGDESTSNKDKAKSSDSSKTSKSTMATDSTDNDKPKRAPIFRANSDQIKAAQKILIKMSMYSGEESGKFSDEFRAGLKLYQEKNGIKVTGTLNALTLETMKIELTDKQKADKAAAASSKSDN